MSQPGNLSFIEKLLAAQDRMPMNSTSMITRPVLKTLASMLGTYNPESDRIEAGLRPGLIDDVIGLPSTIDDISALTGHGTHLGGDISKTAASLSEASANRRSRVSPSRGPVDSALQGVSDVMVSVPGSSPAKLSKLKSALTVAPRAIYDFAVPVMDFSTKTGKAVAGGSAALGAGMGYLGDGPAPDEEDFFARNAEKLDGPRVAPGANFDELYAKAKAGDRDAYAQLQKMYPKVK